LLKCIETALPLGGEIQIVNDGDNYTLSGSGPRLAVDLVLWEALTNPEFQFDHKASQVQFALFHRLYQTLGARCLLTMKQTP
tara:strand:- start:21 stop:266 length:246 start_codon:yes stop_codon:yes gene_type:complete